MPAVAKKARKPTEKSAKDLDYQTPLPIRERLQVFFDGPIPLDPCTTALNPTGALRFFTPKEDGLTRSWQGPGVFANPPYGKDIKFWLPKIRVEALLGVPMIVLLPTNRSEQLYWQEMTWMARAVCWHLKRVAFIDAKTGKRKKSNPYASALWGFNVDFDRFRHAFDPLGLCQRVRSAGVPDRKMVEVRPGVYSLEVA